MKIQSFLKKIILVIFLGSVIGLPTSALGNSPLDKYKITTSDGCVLEAWWSVPGGQSLTYDNRFSKSTIMKYPWYNGLNRPPAFVLKARPDATSSEGKCAGKEVKLFANPASSLSNVEAFTKSNTDKGIVISTTQQLQVETRVGTEGCVSVNNSSASNVFQRDMREKIFEDIALVEQIRQAAGSDQVLQCHVVDYGNCAGDSRFDNIQEATETYSEYLRTIIYALADDTAKDYLTYVEEYLAEDMKTQDGRNSLPQRTTYARKMVRELEFIMATRSIDPPAACEYQIGVQVGDSSVVSMGYLKYNHPDGFVSNVRKWQVRSTAENLSGNSSDTDSPCYNPETKRLEDDCQELISPLPGFGDFVDENLTIGEYFNTMLRIIIGFMGIAAVLLMIFAGIRYMTADAFQAKNNAKELITNSFLGLAVIVSIWIIFNTINPDLLTLDFDQRLEKQTLQVSGTDDNVISGEAREDARRAGVINRGRGYKLTGTYDNPVPNATSTNLAEVNTDLVAGAKIVKIVADVGTGNQTSGKIRFVLDNGKEAIVNTKTGEQGVAEVGQGRSGDKKTPKGEWEVARVSISQNEKNAIENNSGTNMGSVFIGTNATDPTDSSGELRGIGLHGRYDDQLGITYGCLRMDNDDLLILAPHIKVGTPLIIQ